MRREICKSLEQKLYIKWNDHSVSDLVYYYSPDLNVVPKSTNVMHPFGKHGVSLKLVKATLKQLETSSNRAFGLAPHWVAVNPAATSAPDCGKPGVSSKHKKETTQRPGGVSIGPWTLTSETLRPTRHGP